MFALSLVPMLALALDERPATLQRIEPDAATASSKAVVVPSGNLLHTGILLPLDEKGQLVGKNDGEKQIESVLVNLDLALQASKSDTAELVKVNVYVAKNELFADFQKAAARRWPAKARPAVAVMTGALMHPDALIALDAVARTELPATPLVRQPGNELKHQPGGGSLAVLPQGAKVYISGQADPGDDLTAATKKTLEGLDKTLASLRLGKQHVVQVKSFLNPMSEVSKAKEVIEEHYKGIPLPPLVFVEWQPQAKKASIEIELVVAAGKEYRSAIDVVEYLAAPGLPPSPIFSRVCKVHYGPTIYVSSLHARKEGDAKSEVEDVFMQLKDVLKQADSDLKHLVKATYYVSTDETSKALNAVRPSFYDPKRPPAASKAVTQGVGRGGRTLTIDMIAVPTMKVPTTAPEVGHGMTAKEAAEGWISLFDGKTTFGWKDAKIKDGMLTAGESTSIFGRIDIKAEYASDGKISISGKEFSVTAGMHVETVELKSFGTVRLGHGVSLRRLLVKPRTMSSIFNGKEDFDRWKRIDRATIPEERRPVWKVENGAIVAIGGPGALEFQGGDYADLILQIDVKTRKRHANGGVFFRAIPGDFMNGYEAQIYNRCRDGEPGQPEEYATGGIDDRQNARRLVSRDFHYYRMTIIAQGPHLATWINGYQVTDWTDTRKPDDNPRKGLRVKHGMIQLQAHDPHTEVEFKNIMVSGW